MLVHNPKFKTHDHLELMSLDAFWDVRRHWMFAFLGNRDVALACPTDKKYFFFQFYGVISIRVASVPSLSSAQLRKNYPSL